MSGSDGTRLAFASAVASSTFSCSSDTAGFVPCRGAAAASCCAVDVGGGADMTAVGQIAGWAEAQLGGCSGRRHAQLRVWMVVLVCNSLDVWAGRRKREEGAAAPVGSSHLVTSGHNHSLLCRLMSMSMCE